MSEAFDLSSTFVLLARDSSITELAEFSWSNEYLASYEERFKDDGSDGRLVCVIAQDESWDSWERHPAGDELVVLMTGRVDLVQEMNGREVVVSLGAGDAVINPKGVWHRSIVHEPGTALFITPGLGTEHREL